MAANGHLSVRLVGVLVGKPGFDSTSASFGSRLGGNPGLTTDLCVMPLLCLRRFPSPAILFFSDRSLCLQLNILRKYHSIEPLATFAPHRTQIRFSTGRAVSRRKSSAGNMPAPDPHRTIKNVRPRKLTLV